MTVGSRLCIISPAGEREAALPVRPVSGRGRSGTAPQLYVRRVCVKKDTVYLTMLLDYYGDLLTDKQREYFDLHYNQDYTLSEIGEMNGISRQGVWEIVRRAEAAMRAIDERTGLVAKYNERREAVRSIRAMLTPLQGHEDEKVAEAARRSLAALKALDT